MVELIHSRRVVENSKTDLTTRRGFILGISFGVVSLYGLWAAYGAAPTSLAAMFASEDGEEVMGMAAMPGMGGGHEVTPEEFRSLTEAFINANELPDGSVKPARNRPVELSATSAPGSREQQEPVDVYLMAQRYYYEPSVLRLEANLPYRFRMMAIDVTHGASILGSVQMGGHIMRSPAGALSQMTMTFSDPGEYLVYCTVYCGEAHGSMTGRIIVA